MRSQRDSVSTCSYGLPGQAGHFFRRPMRQHSFAPSRGPTSTPTTPMPTTLPPLPPKRKIRDEDESPTFNANTLSTPTHPHSRVVIDEYGNRVLVAGLKRMRVSSPPTVPTTNPVSDDIAMDDTDSDSDVTSIVPLRGMGTTTKSKTHTLTPSAKQAMQQYASTAVSAMDSGASDPSCRAMVLFDPYHALTVERSPRIQLAHDSDADKSASSESEVEFEEEETAPLVRFEELPDDYQEEPEAMELD